MPIESERKFIDLLLQKDIEAFSILYDRYAAALYGIILKEINNPKKADEILTNTFILFNKYLKNRNNLDEGLFLSLYRVTRGLLSQAKASSKS